MDKNYEFKVGAIVRCISNYASDEYCKGKIGKVVEINENKACLYLVEFFESVQNGHTRKGQGNYGYCRRFDKYEIEVYKQPILKLFLQEKQNEV